MGTFFAYLFVELLIWIAGMVFVALLFRTRAKIALEFYHAIFLLVSGIIACSEEYRISIVKSMDLDNYKAIESMYSTLEWVGIISIIGAVIVFLIAVAKAYNESTGNGYETYNKPTGTPLKPLEKNCATCHMQNSSYCSVCKANESSGTANGNTDTSASASPVSEAPAAAPKAPEPVASAPEVKTPARPMFCPHCGNHRVENEPFCTYCGTKIDK